MPPASWSETYRIGHDAIDNHHQDLVENLGRLQSTIAAGRPRTDILGSFDDWLDDFALHARAEERLLERLSLPGGIAHRDAHIAEHAEFLHQAMQLRNHIARGGDAQTAIEALGLQLIAFDLIRRDFEMVGLLLREGIACDS